LEEEVEEDGSDAGGRDAALEHYPHPVGELVVEPGHRRRYDAEGSDDEVSVVGEVHLRGRLDAGGRAGPKAQHVPRAAGHGQWHRGDQRGPLGEAPEMQQDQPATVAT
jgi:hypothetical protein